ncbi:MAG: PEP-CTERM sorting domain-containing protein [Burkholderiales bacterium]|jgi:hypothetical protein|nr:MAG: PEP-CTERM sorting domain-containing protein [Burkholderiales bacterium]
MSPFIRACLRPTALAIGILSVLPLTARADDTSAVVASTTVTLSNLHYELVNLQPNGGSIPAVSFDWTGQLSTTRGFQFPDPDVSQTYGNTLLPASPTTVTGTNGLTSISTTADSVTLQSVTTLQNLQAGGQQISNDPGFHSLNWYNYNSAGLSLSNPNSVAGGLFGMADFGQFTLSANTALRITGTMASTSSLDLTPLLNALTTGTSGTTGTITASANSNGIGPNAQLMLGKLQVNQDSNGNIPSIGVQGSAFSLNNANLSVSNAQPTASDSNSQAFELVFTNLHDTAQTGDLMLSLNASSGIYAGMSYVIPDVPSIPEPSTYALMGLGLVGITLTRRRITS